MFVIAVSWVGACEILPRIFLTYSFSRSVYGATCLKPSAQELVFIVSRFSRKKLNPIIVHILEE